MYSSYPTKGEKRETAKNIFCATLHYNHYSVYGETYILLDGLVCSIVGYFYESRRILASP